MIAICICQLGLTNWKFKSADKQYFQRTYKHLRSEFQCKCIGLSVPIQSARLSLQVRPVVSRAYFSKGERWCPHSAFALSYTIQRRKLTMLAVQSAAPYRSAEGEESNQKSL